MQSFHLNAQVVKLVNKTMLFNVNVSAVYYGRLMVVLIMKSQQISWTPVMSCLHS